MNSIYTVFIRALLPLSLLTLATPALAVKDPATIKDRAGIEQRLGEQVDLSLTFTTQDGSPASLEELLSRGIPTIVSPVYYECPRQCNETLIGVLQLLNELPLELGKDYQVLTYSINPAEGPKLAQAKAQNHYSSLNNPELGPKNWRFLTADAETITSFSDQLGFKYFKDEIGQYVHGSGLMLLTSSGVISRYLIGLRFQPETVRLSLVEASNGKIGSFSDKLVLFCFAFDPSKGKYSLLIWNVSRIILIGFSLLLFAVLAVMRFREKRVRPDEQRRGLDAGVN